MTDAVLAVYNEICRSPAAWGFLCGKIAVLEADLLSRPFFEGILGCSNNAEVRAAMGKSQYSILFPDDKSVSSFNSIIESHAAARRSELFKLCPPYPMENLFTLTARFRSFRTLFNRASSQNNPNVENLDALFPVFTIDGGYATAMTTHRSMLLRKNAPQIASAVERSLYLDSAACTLIKLIGESCPESLVRQYIRDRAILAAWSGIFRARWNGVPADLVRHWFVFGESSEFAVAVTAAENDVKAVVSPRISASASAYLENLDPARIKADIDAAAVDALRETILSCRRVPFGAERALSYLVSLEVELVNLELCLSAVANGIDRKTAASRLRREYA